MNNNHNNFYLYLQKRLLEFSDEEHLVDYKKVEDILTHIRISKSFVPILIKELNYFGLIRRVGKNKVEVINPDSSKNIIIDWGYSGKRKIRC